MVLKQRPRLAERALDPAPAPGRCTTDHSAGNTSSEDSTTCSILVHFQGGIRHAQDRSQSPYSPWPWPTAFTPRDPEIAQKLTGFDAYMEKTLKDWNAPGVGVGIVVNDQLVFAKGYGYRDYEKKLPFTPTTLCPIASNTKLFTAVSAGMLVEEGKLSWDKPIRQSVPAIQFYNDELNNTVTLHDMLSHRTGITRHDTIWYKSEFSAQGTVRPPEVPGTAAAHPADVSL
jgi:CubicO group peptidase (beta-lactamase class C family)